MKKAVLLALALMAGCATASKINSVQLGMTREQVEQTMGRPVSISSQGDIQYLTYRLSETHEDAQFGRTTPYYVRLVSGRVESFGRTGDFNSTQPPVVRQQVEQVGAGANDTYSELLKLKDLHDKGLLTDQEFESKRQKLVNGK